MKSDTARNTYAATAHPHARRQTLKHPIVWSLVLSAGLHAALFAGADRLHPSDPMPVALATDLRAIITIESRLMGNQITQASTVPRSNSLEPTLSPMQSHYTRLRQAVDSHTQKTLAMKQRNQLQAQPIESLQREKTTVAGGNLRLSIEMTHPASSHKALQAQYAGLARAHQTTLAANEQLNQVSDHLQQVHKAQIAENHQLRARALTQTDQITAAKERETLIEMDNTRLTTSLTAPSASPHSLPNATRESESHVQTLEKRAAKSNQMVATSAATRRGNARRDDELEPMTREVDRPEKPLAANANNRPIANKRDTTTVTASPTSGNASSNHQPRPAAGNPKPVYPRLAIKRRLQGDVILTVKIRPTGTISTVTLKHSSGFKLLDSAAIDAVRHWRYEPLPETAMPEHRSDDIPINFRLKSKT
jgi:TonB family protein